ncbi:hypothetical protein GIB67_040294 [Kingdonia uniflora]|uniref:Secoisolariciresinol dehydrogenase n=1 Tax=Kingdonia uniflora TaxID=39325 RepID=A0A7J7MVH5_9MAGN|nr:hypothetical protein GIB67_040294 [Kingdonia uniflora]
MASSSLKPSSLEPWCQLNEKVVMVTGASSGLGRQLCLDLSNTGCKIIAAARRTDRLNSLCEEINRMSSTRGVRAVAVELDVNAEGAVIEKSVQLAWDAFGGRIDALVNNAGVRGTVRSPLDLSEEEWINTFRTNLTGTWLVSKYVCKRMRDADRSGSIINISSISGLSRGHIPGGIAYSASKAGLNNMTKVMALELGAHKIRVNSISPGIFKSEITEDLIQKKWLNNVARKTVPLQKLGKLEPTLESLVRYLIHDSSEYVSGNIFIVDAGATLPGVPIFSSL